MIAVDAEQRFSGRNELTVSCDLWTIRDGVRGSFLAGTFDATDICARVLDTDDKPLKEFTLSFGDIRK
jgi:hypothetical protein